MLEAEFAAGRINENSAHGFRRGGEEVATAVPVSGSRRTDESEIGFVNEGRRLERLSRRLSTDFLAGQSTQLVVDEGQELFGRRGLSVLDCGKEARHLVHEREPTAGGDHNPVSE
jgi:hypothetical protein